MEEMGLGVEYFALEKDPSVHIMPFRGGGSKIKIFYSIPDNFKSRGQ